MAEVKGEYIAVNELKASAKDAKEMRFEGQNIRIAWAEGKRVWDVWETILSASNFSVPATATTLTKTLLNLQSYGTDRLGAQHEMEYTISPTSISANTSTSSRTQSITIKQTKTDKSISVTATQAGRVAQSTTYGTPSVTSTSISTVSASGNVTRYLTVYWSQTKTTTYDNGTTSSTTVTGSSTATVISGSANNSSGAYISGGGVYVPSAGTTYYTSQRTAYTISQFNFTANGISSGTVYRTVYVYQSANTRTTSYMNYYVGLTPNTKYVSSINGAITIKVTATKDKYLSYASGSSEYDGVVGTNANLSSSYGTFNDSTQTSVTVANGSSATFYAYENSSANERNIYVSGVNSESSSAITSLTLIQSAAEVNLKISPESTNIGASGGDVSFVVISTINEKLQTLSRSNVSISGSSGCSLTSLTINNVLEDRYDMKLYVSSNTTTSKKTFYVDVTQPNSGESVRGTINQEGKQSGGGTSGVDVSIETYFESESEVYYFVYFTVPSGYFTGKVELRVQSTINSGGSSYGNIIYNSKTINDGDYLEGTLSLNNYTDPMYLAVYVENEFIRVRRID